MRTLFSLHLTCTLEIREIDLTAWWCLFAKSLVSLFFTQSPSTPPQFHHWLCQKQQSAKQYGKQINFNMGIQVGKSLAMLPHITTSNARARIYFWRRKNTSEARECDRKKERKMFIWKEHILTPTSASAKESFIYGKSIVFALFKSRSCCSNGIHK